MKKRIVVTFFTVLMLVALSVFGVKMVVAASKPIVLKAVTFLPQGHGSAWGWWHYKDMINKAANGRLVLEFAGASEAIPGFEQPEAVRTGAVDVSFTVAAYYKTIVPEANSLHLSTITPWEERKSGFHSLMVELHKKKNIHFLGRQLFNAPFIMVSSKRRIERPQDLRGLRFRTSGLYDALYKKLGIAGITTPIGDQYSALDRGLVDGTSTTPSSALKFSFHEVAKYVIGPLFYGAQNGVMLINLDSWNRIPKDLQDLMIETQIKAERDIYEHYSKTVEGQLKQLRDRGMEFVKWSPSDNKLFLGHAYQGAWEEVEKKTSPETASRLRKLMSR